MDLPYVKYFLGPQNRGDYYPKMIWKYITSKNRSSRLLVIMTVDVQKFCKPRDIVNVAEFFMSGHRQHSDKKIPLPSFSNNCNNIAPNEITGDRLHAARKLMLFTIQYLILSV